MPLTPKGEEIKRAMAEQYGPKKGESVFYASKNKGTITGVDSKDQSDPKVSLTKPKTMDVNEPDIAEPSKSRMPVHMGGDADQGRGISAEPVYQQAVSKSENGPGYTVVGSQPYRPVENPGGVSLADMNRINKDRYPAKRR
jgi:hypothetical protein